MKEYLQRVYNSIVSHPDLLALGDGVAQLLVQQAQSVVLMHRAVENVQYRLQKSQEEVKNYLYTNFPVLSRIGPWLRSRLRKAEQRFSQENQWSAHEEALALCNAQRLHQTVYFLNRDLAFMREVGNRYRNFVKIVISQLSPSVGGFVETNRFYAKIVDFYRENLHFYVNYVKFRRRQGVSCGPLRSGYPLTG